jgi:hypothetical protein
MLQPVTPPPTITTCARLGTVPPVTAPVVTIGHLVWELPSSDGKGIAWF